MNIISFCSLALTKPAVTRQQCKGTPPRHISGRLGSPQVRAASPSTKTWPAPLRPCPSKERTRPFPQCPSLPPPGDTPGSPWPQPGPLTFLFLTLPSG